MRKEKFGKKESVDEKNLEIEVKNDIEKERTWKEKNHDNMAEEMELELKGVEKYESEEGKKEKSA